MKKTLIATVSGIVSFVSLHSAVGTPVLIHEGYDTSSDFTIVAKLKMDVFKTYVKSGESGKMDSLIIGMTSGENKQTGVSTVYTSTSFFWDTISSSFLTGAWDHTTYCTFGDSNWKWDGKPENWDKDLSDIPWGKVADGVLVYTWNASHGSETYGTTAGLVLVDSVGKMIVEGFTRNDKLISSGKSLNDLEFGYSIDRDGIFYYSDSLKTREDAISAVEYAMTVPEPSSLCFLVGVGALMVTGLSRRQRK